MWIQESELSKAQEVVSKADMVQGGFSLLLRQGENKYVGQSQSYFIKCPENNKYGWRDQDWNIFYSQFQH